MFLPPAWSCAVSSVLTFKHIDGGWSYWQVHLYLRQCLEKPCDIWRLYVNTAGEEEDDGLSG